MPDPQGDEGSPPRKRIAVAVSLTPHFPTLIGRIGSMDRVAMKATRSFSLSGVVVTRGGASRSCMHEKCLQAM